MNVKLDVAIVFNSKEQAVIARGLDALAILDKDGHQRAMNIADYGLGRVTRKQLEELVGHASSLKDFLQEDIRRWSFSATGTIGKGETPLMMDESKAYAFLSGTRARQLESCSAALKVLEPALTLIKHTGAIAKGIEGISIGRDG